MARSDSGFSQPATGASGKNFRHAALAVALAAAFAPATGWGFFDDKVEVWAAYNLTHDTNVFRLSDKVGAAAIGDRQLDDTIHSTFLGVTVGIPWSQQRFEAAYTWFRSRYQHFKDLDHDGHTARAQWNWSFQHRLKGTVGYNETETLASFANIQGRTPDLVTSRRVFLTGEWQMTPRWKPHAGVSAIETEHTDPGRRINNIEAASAEAGLSYTTPRDSTIGGFVRTESGKNPDAPVFAGVPFDNEYKQWGVGVLGTWPITGVSRLDGRAEWIHREYDQVGQRDFDGPIFSLLHHWTPTGKLTIESAIVRAVGPAEEIQTSFVLVTGGYVRARWNATEKITVLGNLEYNVWDYRGNDANPLAPAAVDFKHKQTLVGASVQWKPWQRIWLHAGVNREIRRSTLPTGDYEVTVGFIEGRVGF